VADTAAGGIRRTGTTGTTGPAATPTSADSPLSRPAATLGHGDAATGRLLALFDGHRLSPTQRRIARYLLDHWPDAAFLSSVDLANLAAVSQPSVTRFAVALGFTGYPAMREALRPIAVAGVTGRPDGPEEARRNEFQAAVAAERRNIDALHAALAEPAVVTALGRELAASCPLVVFGARLSAALARYFADAAGRIHPDARCLTGRGSAASDALLQARSAGGTWMLAFAMPRYPAETVRCLGLARSLGLKVAAMTDVPLVPFAEDVDVLLPAGVGARLLFDSYAAPMVLAAVLLQAMADARPERTRRRLAAHERLAGTDAHFHDR